MTFLQNIKNLVGDRFGGRTAPGMRSGATKALDALSENYESEATLFYEYLPIDVRHIFIADAIYHKPRYLELLDLSYGRRVLELGSDKPFISHFLRELNPQTEFETVSIDIPFSKYPITRTDIESQLLPFEPGSFSDVIFTEVLEHLFRDPAWTCFQINRSLVLGGTLFMTTPNACGYDGLINFLNQSNPNARSQFFASIESGHPHLWTGKECRLLLESHGFEIVTLDTVDYVPIPKPAEVAAFLDAYSSEKSMHGQTLRILARKVSDVGSPSYPSSLFPDGKPVQLQGALREWAIGTIRG